MHECVFCRIVRGEDRSEVIYDDDQVIALMDICPISKTFPR
jgi:diadenosine tetraphosphate (Ap4A) HIT family hydrolase